MSQYDTGRPLQDVRLRNWPAGRANVLKLAVQRLESELNSLLPASVAQSDRRKVSDQVPFPLSVTVQPGFRQAIVRFTRPPGLDAHPRRQLLFYEVQHATDAGFSNPTVIESKETQIAIAGLGIGETRSFRVRVVNTLNDASPWSNTVTVRLAQSQIQQTALPDASVRLTAPVGQWQKIIDVTFQPVESSTTILCPIAVAGPVFDTTQKDPSAVVRKVLRGGPAFVQFRFRAGSLNAASQEYELKAQGDRTLLSVRPGFAASDTADKSGVRNPLAFGTLPTPFFKLTSGISARVILEASLMPGSEWLGSEKERSSVKTDPVVFSRNGQIIEVLEDI